MMGGYGELAAALAAFLGGHLVPAIHPLRDRLVAMAGRPAYLAGFSLVSIALLAWLVAAALRAPYTPLWPYAAWMPWVPVLVMPGVFILAVEGLRTPNPFSLTAAGTRLDGRPCGLLRVVRHPLPWALALWGLAHVAANPDLRAVLVFGLLALFSIAGRAPLAARRRRALGEAGWAAADAAARQCPGPVVRPGSVAAGLAAYAAGLALHPWLFGVAPLAAL